MVGRMIREAIETVADEVSSSLAEMEPKRTVAPPPMPPPPTQPASSTSPAPPRPPQQVQHPAPLQKPVAMVVQAESPPMAEDNVGVEADDKPELQPTTSTKKPPAKAKRVPRPKPRKPSPDAINEPDNLKRPNVVKEVEVAESDSYPQPSDGLNVNQLEVDVAEARLLLLDTKRDLRLARRAERATRRLERREHRRDRHLG